MSNAHLFLNYRRDALEHGPTLAFKQLFLSWNWTDSSYQAYCLKYIYTCLLQITVTDCSSKQLSQKTQHWPPFYLTHCTWMTTTVINEEKQQEQQWLLFALCRSRYNCYFSASDKLIKMYRYRAGTRGSKEGEHVNGCQGRGSQKERK